MVRRSSRIKKTPARINSGEYVRPANKKATNKKKTKNDIYLTPPSSAASSAASPSKFESRGLSAKAIARQKRLALQKYNKFKKSNSIAMIKQRNNKLANKPKSAAMKKRSRKMIRKRALKFNKSPKGIERLVQRGNFGSPDYSDGEINLKKTNVYDRKYSTKIKDTYSYLVRQPISERKIQNIDDQIYVVDDLIKSNEIPNIVQQIKEEMPKIPKYTLNDSNEIVRVKKPKKPKAKKPKKRTRTIKELINLD